MRSRETIIDAVHQEIGSSGFGGVSIAGVAQRAGVSRQTVYSIFGNREALIADSVQHRLLYLHGHFGEILERAESPVDVFIAFIVECRRLVHGDAMLKALAMTGGSNPMFEAGAADRAREFTAALLAPLAERFPETAGRLPDLADLCVHVGWSVLCIDDVAQRSDDDLRQFLYRWIGPAFAEIGR